MRPRAAILLALAGVAALAGAASPEKPETPEKPPPPVGVSLTSLPAAERLDVVLPGECLGVALPRRREGGRSVVYLVGRENGERALVALRGRELVELASGLAGDVRDLAAADLDGDGDEELLLSSPAGLLAIATGGGAPATPELLPATARRSAVAAIDGGGGARELLLAGVGAAELWRRGARGEGTIARRFDLPIGVAREAHGLRLSSAPITVLDRGAGRRPLLAIGPDEAGATRLRTVLIDLERPPEEAVGESWSQLPAPEEIVAHRYLLLSGQPRLVVATLSRERQGAFDKQSLRAFSLAADRTRAGKRPLLAAATEAHRWQPIAVFARDADHDGREDLVTLEPTGLSGDELAITGFAGDAHGLVRQLGVRSTVETHGGESRFDGDVDGDGVADLVVAGDDRIEVFRGLPLIQNRWVEKKPRLTLERGAARGKETIAIGAGSDGVSVDEESEPRGLWVVDLDGDGRAEILVLGDEAGGRGTSQLFSAIR